MTAGSGSDKYQEALNLERLLIERFGPDFRDKVIMSALGSFRLADSFAECGLPDPHTSPSPSSYGLFQFMPSNKGGVY